MNHFTVNPTFPHPDQDTDAVQAESLFDAVRYAMKVLRDPNSDQFARNRAASDLDAAYWAEVDAA